MNLPAISVIIPLYNAEKYIGECLDSILNQTFQDFEVIVVDDCSTDKSVSIVQMYATKFNGRLKLAKTQKNSGGGGYVPRNFGLKLSRGEYIFFADADDVVAKNAFEILIAAAQNFEADVVYVSRHYSCGNNGDCNLISDEIGLFAEKKGIAEEPTLTLNDPNKNLRLLLFKAASRNPWTKFVRRDFLIENDIEFPNVISGGDFLWCIQVFCHAKRFLRLPLSLYFYRSDSAESVSRKKRTPSEQSVHWVAAFVAWLKALNELTDKTEILRRNSFYCRQALALHFLYCLEHCSEGEAQPDSQELYDALYREFSKSPYDLTVPFFFSVIDTCQKNLVEAQERITELEEALKGAN